MTRFRTGGEVKGKAVTASQDPTLECICLTACNYSLVLPSCSVYYDGVYPTIIPFVHSSMPACPRSGSHSSHFLEHQHPRSRAIVMPVRSYVSCPPSSRLEVRWRSVRHDPHSATNLCIHFTREAHSRDRAKPNEEPTKTTRRPKTASV